MDIYFKSHLKYCKNHCCLGIFSIELTVLIDQLFIQLKWQRFSAWLLLKKLLFVHYIWIPTNVIPLLTILYFASFSQKATFFF
jgi:hypothetical protein